MLGMLGLAMVGSLSGRSMVKGVAAALFGLWLATIGLPDSQAIPRYTFGTLYLLDDLPLIPVLLGLFAIPEIMDLAIKNLSISSTGSADDNRKGLLQGVRDAFQNWWLVVRCSVIGSYIGMLPGLGASIVGWVTYAHAKQSAKDDSQFGQGDVRGVLAPEAANNALRGGALIPTLTLGIPGSVGTAILMGALIMQGLRPGPSMLDAKLPMTFSFVWMIAIASVVATLVLLRTVNQVAKIALMPSQLLVPGVLLFVFMGAWLGGASIGAWVTCVLFGVVGYFMKRGGWPRPPVILALVLGEILERSFQISTRIHEGFGWVERPIVVGLFLAIVATLVLAARGFARQKRSNVPATGEAAERNPAISLSIIVMVRDLADLLERKRAAGGWRMTLQAAGKDAKLAKALPFFAYLIGVILLTLLVGQKIALPVFIGVYLLRWGHFKPRVALAYSLGAWAILVFFYDQVMQLLFHPSLLAIWMQPRLPSNFPDWLLF